MFDREAILRTFADNLKEYRTNRGISQAKLAGMIDVDERQIRRFERGTSAATIVLAYRIAKVLEVSLDKLFEEYVTDQ